MATGETLMPRQSGDKHNQLGLQLPSYKTKGIVASWDLKVIFCLSLLLEVFTEKLCLYRFFLVFCVLLLGFMQ